MKRLIVAVVILIGLFAALRWWPEKKPASAATPALVKFDPGQANRIEVDQSGQPAVILDKVKDQWQLAQPYAAAADSGAVTTLLTTASSLAPAEKIGAEKNLAPFGLDDAASVAISLANGSKYRFLFGSNTPTGDDLYLKLADSPDVYTVPTYVKGDMIKAAFDLRDKSVLHLTSDKVDSVALRYRGKSLEFKRSNGKWTGPQADNIQNLADAIVNAQMDAIVDPTGKTAAKYGLAHPATVVSLVWKGGQGRLEVGNKKGESEYYARSSESPAVFTINSYLTDDMADLIKPPTPAPTVSATTVAAPAQARKKKPKTGKAKAAAKPANSAS